MEEKDLVGWKFNKLKDKDKTIHMFIHCDYYKIRVHE